VLTLRLLNRFLSCYNVPYYFEGQHLRWLCFAQIAIGRLLHQQLFEIRFFCSRKLVAAQITTVPDSHHDYDLVKVSVVLRRELRITYYLQISSSGTLLVPMLADGCCAPPLLLVVCDCCCYVCQLHIVTVNHCPTAKPNGQFYRFTGA
jgi:hypothetical protein